MSALRRAAGLAALAGMLALGGCSLLQAIDHKLDKEAARIDAPDATDEPAAGPAPEPSVRRITQQTPAIKTYRKLAAAQIYKAYPTRIYKGKIPPLVHAVVVVETDIDADGKVLGVFYSRVPSHAPDVPPKIAELIKAASPLPSPGKLGAHTYVDTWLWDKSGNFQLDTLTLGQRSK